MLAAGFRVGDTTESKKAAAFVGVMRGSDQEPKYMLDSCLRQLPRVPVVTDVT